MPKSQPRVTSQSALLDRMREAVDAGKLSEAADIFDQCVSPSGAMALLFGWTLIKKRQYAGAIEFLSRPSFPRSDRQQDAERFMLLGIAHSRCARFTEADEYFERASADASLTASGKLAYWRGRRYLEERRVEEAQAQLKLVRATPGDEARIQADLLESGILTQQERYLDGALVLMHLLEFMDGLSREHRVEEIWALHTLAARARELSAPKIRSFVQVRIRRQEWTQDFTVNQFQTYKAVAWCHALEGDYFNAFRYLKLAGAIAPSAAWQAMTLLDRAYLARCIDESVWSRSELAEAEEILETIHWGESDDEERVALPIAAELLAAHDTGRAASYLAKFFGMRDAISPQLHFRYDDRLKALAEYANGVVQMKIGNRKAALASLRYSWGVYDKAGYDWRAGRCALRLFDLTRELRWRARAAEKLRSYSGSWLAEELRRESDAAMPHLHPMQKKVFDLLLEGKTTEQIAKETGRSPFTISNHIKIVLRAFGVPNRARLIAEAMKRRSNDSATRRRR